MTFPFPFMPPPNVTTETVWVFQMCREGDNLFLTGLSDGRLTLCRNAFLEIPSCMRWTLWGLFEPLHILNEGKRRKRILFYFFPVSGRTLIQMKWGQTDIQTDFYLKLLCLSSPVADGGKSVCSTEVSGELFIYLSIFKPKYFVQYETNNQPTWKHIFLFIIVITLLIAVK